MSRAFEDLVTEVRLSLGYQRLLSQRLASASTALDIQTGGGEVLAGVQRFPSTMAATESWAPNVAKATRLPHARGVVVVVDPDQPPLPFADEAFDVVTSRHPATVWWGEIVRVLRPGGTYFAQHVGPATVFELVEYFLGPQPEARHGRHPDVETAEARAAGLEVVNLRVERLRMEFFDIGLSPSTGGTEGDAVVWIGHAGQHRGVEDDGCRVLWCSGGKRRQVVAQVAAGQRWGAPVATFTAARSSLCRSSSPGQTASSQATCWPSRTSIGSRSSPARQTTCNPPTGSGVEEFARHANVGVAAATGADGATW